MGQTHWSSLPRNERDLLKVSGSCGSPQKLMLGIETCHLLANLGEDWS